MDFPYVEVLAGLLVIFGFVLALVISNDVNLSFFK
jgi:hypothetical protein